MLPLILRLTALSLLALICSPELACPEAPPEPVEGLAEWVEGSKPHPEFDEESRLTLRFVDKDEARFDVVDRASNH